MEFKLEKFLSHRFALPVTVVVDQMLLTMRKKGWGGEDHSALLKVIEDLSEHAPGKGMALKDDLC